MAYARFNEFEPSDDRSTPTYDGVQAKIRVQEDPPAGRGLEAVATPPVSPELTLLERPA